MKKAINSVFLFHRNRKTGESEKINEGRKKNQIVRETMADGCCWMKKNMIEHLEFSFDERAFNFRINLSINRPLHIIRHSYWWRRNKYKTEIDK